MKKLLFVKICMATEKNLSPGTKLGMMQRKSQVIRTKIGCSLLSVYDVISLLY